MNALISVPNDLISANGYYILNIMRYIKQLVTAIENENIELNISIIVIKESVRP